MSIIQSGQNRTDVLNGKVRIEDGNQRLIAENDDGTTIILGRNNSGEYGISYYDSDGNLVSKSNGASTVYYNTVGKVIAESDRNRTVYYDSSDNARILIGLYDDRPGVWVSKDGVDVITELVG